MYNEYFLIGYITKTRGLKGELQLFFQFDAAEFDAELLEFDVMFIEISKKLVPFFVSSYQLLANRTGYFFLEDIDHIDKANELVGKQVFLPNDKKPHRDPDDFQITDLKGFRVFDEKHGDLGEITEIKEFPQQYIATVTYRAKEIMFPLIENFIIDIDRGSKTLKIELPDGLVEIYLQT